jgi:hypothetical protein
VVPLKKISSIDGQDSSTQKDQIFCDRDFMVRRLGLGDVDQSAMMRGSTEKDQFH